MEDGVSKDSEKTSDDASEKPKELKEPKESRSRRSFLPSARDFVMLGIGCALSAIASGYYW